MFAKSVLVTGANRGVGLGLVKALLKHSEPPSVVIATYRNLEDAKELQEVAAQNSALRTLQFDVTDRKRQEELVTEVSNIVGEDGLNLLINNGAATGKRGPFEDIEWDDMLKICEINFVATVYFTKLMLPLLRKAANAKKDYPVGVGKAAIVNVSTKVASLDDNTSGRHYPYRCSKVALNMATKSMSVELADDGILACCLHPGWVQTRMGGPNALISVEQSTTAIVNTLANLTKADNGTFFQFDGKKIPW